MTLKDSNPGPLPFGKHKGATLDRCPPDYLRWMVQARVSGWHQHAQNELDRRQRDGEQYKFVGKYDYY